MVVNTNMANTSLEARVETPELTTERPTKRDALLEMIAKGMVSDYDGLSETDSRYTTQLQSRTEQLESAPSEVMDYLLATLLSQREEIKELTAKANFDNLTKVANRNGYNAGFNRIYETNKRHPEEPLSMLFLDIDHFKKFNDTHGHQAGDAVLKTVAEKIRSTVRPQDLVARFGGEEFYVVLPEADAEGAYKVAERVRKAIESTTVHYGDNELKVTASIGISSLKDLPRPLETDPKKASELLLQYADQAVYTAKRNGRNRVEVYTP